MTIKKSYLPGLDLLKLLTLFAISILHANEFVFFENEFPLGWEAPIWKTCSFYARLFAIGGQILIATIYFLFGFTQKSKLTLFKISIFCLVGQILLGISFKTIEWDIYSFILITNLFIITLPFFYKKNQYSLIISLLVTIIPPIIFQKLFNQESLGSILTGNYYLSSSGSWPLLPWFFLATFFYQLGLFASETQKYKNWYRQEKAIWIILFLISIPRVGAYYNLPIGPDFYHFAFYQDPYTFYSNFLPFLFLARISVLERWQNYFKNIKLVQLISRSYWNRYLGITYLYSILYLGIGMNYKSYFYYNPWAFDLYFIGIMPISEIFSRATVFLKLKLRLK